MVLVAVLWAAVSLAALPVYAADPASVTVRAVMESDGTFQVTVMVVDAKGAVVPEAPVVLKVRTAFGWLPVAKRATDASGRARVTLPPNFRGGEITTEAGEDGQASATIRFGRAEFRPLSVRPGRDVLGGLSPQPGFISPYPVATQVALLAVVLGGIWVSYGYVAWLLSRIRTS